MSTGEPGVTTGDGWERGKGRGSMTEGGMKGGALCYPEKIQTTTYYGWEKREIARALRNL